MRRRDFITLIGGAAAPSLLCTLAARAQQPVVVGFLSQSWPDRFPYLPGLRQGLKDAGYVEGENLKIEYRWAEGQNDRLPALADELVRRQAAVIMVGPGPALLAASAATKTIPIIFQTGGDVVKQGLIASLNRPGGNLTGVMQLAAALTAKRLELLHQLVPQAALIATFKYLQAVTTDDQAAALQAAARALGVRLLEIGIGDERDFEPAFAKLTQEGAGALFVGSASFFVSRRDQIVSLAGRHRVPAVYESREFNTIGGLMSYGTDFSTVYRQVGRYAGRVLNGEKVGDLPVVQPIAFDLVINLKTAKVLGLEVPPQLIALADEVIE